MLTLVAVIHGLRILALVLAAAILLWWGPSLFRVLVDRARDRDPSRAVWTTLAVAVILFQARWLWPGLADLTRLQLWAMAHAAIAMTLACAIYLEASHADGFRVRRAMMIHLGMLVMAAAAAAVAR